MTSIDNKYRCVIGTYTLSWWCLQHPPESTQYWWPPLQLSLHCTCPGLFVHTWTPGHESLQFLLDITEAGIQTQRQSLPTRDVCSCRQPHKLTNTNCRDAHSLLCMLPKHKCHSCLTYSILIEPNQGSLKETGVFSKSNLVVIILNSCVPLI